MTMQNKDVLFLCGKYPEGHSTLDIDSDPNFIFQNDPDFMQVRLFDSEGNTVLVNSFTECEHYVNGTWDYYPGKDEINYLANINFFLIALIFSTLVIRVYLKRKSA